MAKKPKNFAEIARTPRHIKASAKGGSAPSSKPKGLAALSPERRKEIQAMAAEARRKKGKPK